MIKFFQQTYLNATFDVIVQKADFAIATIPYAHINHDFVAKHVFVMSFNTRNFRRLLQNDKSINKTIKIEKLSYDFSKVNFVKLKVLHEFNSL
jgi:hypothetical protein